MVRSSKTARAPRPPVHWLELALPLYALAIVVLYYRSNSVDLVMADEQLEGIVLWAAWILGGVFGVMLALPGSSWRFASSTRLSTSPGTSRGL